jgi:hypothetical protein
VASVVNPSQQQLTGVTAVVNGLNATGSSLSDFLKGVETSPGGAPLAASPVFLNFAGVLTPPTNTAALTFAPQSAVMISDSLGIVNGAGTASITSVENTDFVVVSAVPEPYTLGLVGVGLAAFGGLLRRRTLHQ